MNHKLTARTNHIDQGMVELIETTPSGDILWAVTHIDNFSPALRCKITDDGETTGEGIDFMLVEL